MTFNELHPPRAVACPVCGGERLVRADHPGFDGESALCPSCRAIASLARMQVKIVEALNDHSHSTEWQRRALESVRHAAQSLEAAFSGSAQTGERSEG